MPCYKPIWAACIKGPDGKNRLLWKVHKPGQMLALPCGRCIGCRLEKARQWAVRCMHEESLHEKSCVLSLTYAEGQVPDGKMCGCGAGSLCAWRHGVGSVCLDDLQKFFKRLRRYVAASDRIRYFACGEYGELCSVCGAGRRCCRCVGFGKTYTLGRPHYHALVFGFEPEDMVWYKGEGVRRLYTSESVTEIWGKGHVTVGHVSFESAAYVAGYITKKLDGPKARDWYGNRHPEFVVMSRRPGIGAGWWDEFHSDAYPADSVIVHGRECRPPRYYDTLTGRAYPELMAALKEKRLAFAKELSDKAWDKGQLPDVCLSRLKVREAVARSKHALKSRELEGK